MMKKTKTNKYNKKKICIIIWNAIHKFNHSCYNVDYKKLNIYIDIC